jgi:hypothetical protein
LVSEPPAQRRDFETKALKTADDGRPLFSVRVLLMDGKDSAPLRVTVIGDPGVVAMQPVRLHGLAVNVMDRKAETISWWTAQRVEPLGPPIVSADGEPGGVSGAASGRGRGGAGKADA